MVLNLIYKYVVSQNLAAQHRLSLYWHTMHPLTRQLPIVKLGRHCKAKYELYRTRHSLRPFVVTYVKLRITYELEDGLLVGVANRKVSY